jgi:hypothetical protein
MESMESYGISGITWNQWNHMESTESTESTESHEISWNPMESADSAVLESFGITWNHVESLGIMESWNHRISCFPLGNNRSSGDRKIVDFYYFNIIIFKNNIVSRNL